MENYKKGRRRGRRTKRRRINPSRTSGCCTQLICPYICVFLELLWNGPVNCPVTRLLWQSWTWRETTCLHGPLALRPEGQQEVRPVVCFSLLSPPSLVLWNSGWLVGCQHSCWTLTSKRHQDVCVCYPSFPSNLREQHRKHSPLLLTHNSAMH